MHFLVFVFDFFTRFSNPAYSMLLAWCANAFFSSFKDEAPWGDEDLTGETAIEYFKNKIIGMESLAQGGATRVIGANVGYSLMSWFTIWLCVAFGVKWTGR